ncbi:CPBP family intramembrane glutamic endopeptidase [Aeoliella mucimassa]|uniref:CAAX amino terminal protease self-immunity n=1 Tax=Aeoliella mucimassa TaxID=2527972 RepID=A0A518AR08_9BACT|nr:CPBP family intramembrane glutamic endopeptidase [Aeoliella mucimassa]QDU57162.1 CAAX amino terminal protease self- immunity [Aeoliella mucimassa]
MADKQPKTPSEISAQGELMAIGIACVLPTFVTLAYFVAAAEMESGVQQAVFAVAKVVQFSLPAAWVGLVCRERLGWPAWNPRGLALGIAFGLVIAAATFGLYFWLSPTELMQQALVPIREKITGMNLNSPVKFIGLGVFYSLFHSLLEEYYWRWFVFGRLRRFVPVGVAIAISSIAFAAHHVVVLWVYFSHAPAVALLLAAGVAVGGAFWAWLYHRTQSIYSIWASHLLVDAAIFGVGYFISELLA